MLQLTECQPPACPTVELSAPRSSWRPRSLPRAAWLSSLPLFSEAFLSSFFIYFLSLTPTGFPPCRAVGMGGCGEGHKASSVASRQPETLYLFAGRKISPLPPPPPPPHPPPHPCAPPTPRDKQIASICVKGAGGWEGKGGVGWGSAGIGRR